ncbi:MAG: amidohydrolase [Proteobacteria bacterium]|nr:amidohydrolase [Pseudomonadota bacterium]
MWDLLIINACLVTQEPDRGPIPRGFVAVQDGVLAALGSMSDLDPEHGAAKSIDARGGLVMPGLVNTHIHGAMTLFRGLADDLPLMVWLNEHIFPAEAAHVNEELVYWGTKLACAEMLLSGTTGFADGYFLEDQAARAAQEAGLRCVMGQGVIDFPAPGVPDPGKNLKTAREFLEKWRGVSPLIQPSVFCHSPYTCSKETLIGGKELAREFGTIFQIHVSETREEVEQVRSDRGLTPVRYLDDLGLLDESTLAVHCVWVDDEEIDILARRRTPAVVCVESHMKLASGSAPVVRMLARGVNVAMGTDGPASNNNLNMFGEAGTLARLTKVREMDPTALPAARALYLAGPAGAAALGWRDVTGMLKPGLRADLIVLDLSPPHLTPLYRPRSHLVYASNGHEIRTVLVDGRVVVEDGRLIAFDLRETLARVREIADGIRG